MYRKLQQTLIYNADNQCHHSQTSIKRSYLRDRIAAIKPPLSSWHKQTKNKLGNKLRKLAMLYFKTIKYGVENIMVWVYFEGGL